MQKRELLGLQYLRAIAALFVVLTHTESMCRFEKYFGREILDGKLIAGTVGVDLFFVISGFIITYVTLDDTLKPNISVKPFFYRRFVRIIPFMWLCVIGYAALRLVGRGSFPVIPYLRSLVLFPIGHVEPNQIWTLRHEALYYILFAFCLIQFKNRWALLIWFISPFIWHSLPIDHDSTSVFTELGNFLFNRVNITFGLGYLLGLGFKKGLIDKQINVPASFLVTILASLPLFASAIYFKIGIVELSLIESLCLGIVAMLLVLFGIIQHPNSLSQFDRFGLLLGNASYAIYLTHPAIISGMLGIWSKRQPDANLFFMTVVIFLACIVVGLFAHFFIEKPIIKFVQRIFIGPNTKRFVSQLQPR